ncbi:protein of unknown function [Candidatus Nitrosotalea okcheonensis]|uniref:Uncharacterized protein n=2 Tax=Candidatus Nitrosotalea okcheonensis TaxID=1903276 RepID=A0A2H1FHI4_9ARCH|nr:protein of unknown function [Candidatus Nitrosotalea okcheonensis]
MDRDVIASMNISYKGWSRFCHPRGLSEEAVNGNLEYIQPVILQVAVASCLSDVMYVIFH